MEDDAKKLVAKFANIMRRYKERVDHLSSTLVNLEVLHEDVLNLMNPEDLEEHAPNTKRPLGDGGA